MTFAIALPGLYLLIGSFLADAMGAEDREFFSVMWAWPLVLGRMAGGHD